MATDLGKKLAQSQLQNQSIIEPNSTTSSWMWNPNQQYYLQAQIAVEEDDESWEERAFQEDTNQVMGTTWPPRSYTCTFCMREFKSAQALGGHMNVHRRDRVRLHHQVQPSFNSSSSQDGAYFPKVIYQTQEFTANSGVCLLYTVQNPITGGCNEVRNPSAGRLSIPQFQPTNLVQHIPMPVGSPVTPHSIISCRSDHSSNTKTLGSADYDDNKKKKWSPIEELDLELRLGCNSSMS